MRKVIILLLAIAMMAGCGRRGPQRPTYRSGQAPKQDTAALALMTLTMRVAEEADVEVKDSALAQDSTLALHEECNTWYRIERAETDTITPQKDEKWEMHIVVYTLGGKMLTDEQKEYMIGRAELPNCVEEILPEMHHGDHAILYAPWYSAYGSSGNTAIPPYQNIKMELTIL